MPELQYWSGNSASPEVIWAERMNIIEMGLH
jgi:hypothetical protein